MTSAEAGPPAFYPGRIDESLLATAVPDLALSVVCLCGPGAMIDDLVGLLRRRGVPEAQIRYERFAAAIASVGAVQHDHEVHGGAAAEHVDGTTAAEITFSRSAQQFAAERGETILEAAEARGVPIPSLCRAGVCGTCRARVSEGEVDCESTALSSGDRAQGYVLACVARARTACVVEA